MYNLGYTNLFPSLNGGQFPLTQSMQVELGVIAAAALVSFVWLMPANSQIAGAIQFKVVTMLQTRRKRLVEEEEAKIEAVEISRAAELFKNVDAELAEWEGKYGGKSDSGTETLADTLQMGKGMPRSMSSAPTTPGIDSPSIESRNLNLTPIIDTPRRLSLMEEMGYKEDPKVDPELEQKVQLLAEVRRARQSIRSSMDYLRSVGTTPLDPAAASGSSDGPHSDRPGSPSSSRILDRGRYDSGSSSLMLLNVGSTERPRKNSLGPNLEASTVGSVIGSRLSLADVGRMASSPEGRPQSDNRPLTEWEQYLDSRTVVSPPPVSPPTSNLERYSVVSNSVSRAVTQRADRAPSAGQEYGANLARAIGASEATAAAAAATNPLRSPGPMGSTSRRASKAMTTEEFAERHQKMLTKMQDRVSAPIKEEQALVVAKSEWDEKKRLEREEQRRRAQRTEREGMVDGRPPRHADRTRRTEEWRRSVAVSPPPSPNLSTAQRSTAPAPAPATPRQQVQRRDSRPVA
jgi:hypothetical protein